MNIHLKLWLVDFPVNIRKPFRISNKRRNSRFKCCFQCHVMMYAGFMGVFLNKKNRVEMMCGEGVMRDNKCSLECHVWWIYVFSIKGSGVRWGWGEEGWRCHASLINDALYAVQHVQYNLSGTMPSASRWHYSLRVTLDMLPSIQGSIYILQQQIADHNNGFDTLADIHKMPHVILITTQNSYKRNYILQIYAYIDLKMNLQIHIYYRRCLFVYIFVLTFHANDCNYWQKVITVDLIHTLCINQPQFQVNCLLFLSSLCTLPLKFNVWLFPLTKFVETKKGQLPNFRFMWWALVKR